MFFRSRKIKPERITEFSESGFTLIEVVVSVGIVVMISAIFIANYHGANQKSALELAAQKLASDIRFAQNNSLGTAMFNDAPAESWGFNIDTAQPDKYKIFADQDKTKTYSGIGELFREIKLPSGITIKQITPSVIGSFDIVFLPPFPKVFINSLNYQTSEIVLADIEGRQKSIFINFFGLIEVR